MTPGAIAGAAAFPLTFIWRQRLAAYSAQAYDQGPLMPAESRY